MTRRVLLVMNGSRIVAINRTALLRPNGVSRLLRDLAEYSAQQRVEFEARKLLPRMPKVCS